MHFNTCVKTFCTAGSVADVHKQHLVCSVQGVWSRALGLPIERPKSFTMDALEKKVGAK